MCAAGAGAVGREKGAAGRSVARDRRSAGRLALNEGSAGTEGPGVRVCVLCFAGVVVGSEPAPAVPVLVELVSSHGGSRALVRVRMRGVRVLRDTGRATSGDAWQKVALRQEPVNAGC